jgi:hypothetical protein
MRLFLHVAILSSVIVVSACGSGNLKTSADYDAPAAPPIQHPNYDPYAAYGQANAIWQPPAADRNGTIVKPHEPSTSLDRPDYEHAPWATRGETASSSAPRGRSEVASDEGERRSLVADPATFRTGSLIQHFITRPSTFGDRASRMPVDSAPPGRLFRKTLSGKCRRVRHIRRSPRSRTAKPCSGAGGRNRVGGPPGYRREY